jgi:mono/diheme cytochrome c family protein
MKKHLLLGLALLLGVFLVAGCAVEEEPIKQPVPKVTQGEEVFHKVHQDKGISCATCHQDMSDTQFTVVADGGAVKYTVPVNELKEVNREACLACHSTGDKGFYQQ